MFDYQQWHSEIKAVRFHNMLEVFAGQTAIKTIQAHGFKQELFSNFLGARGGPKRFHL